MVLEVVDLVLAQFEKDGEEIPAKMMKAIDNKEFFVPVVLRVGAVDYKIGDMIRVRRGRGSIFGDLTLNIIEHLELDVDRSESGEVTGVKPKKFVYVRE